MIGRLSGLSGWRAFTVSAAILIVVTVVMALILHAIVGGGHRAVVAVVSLVTAGVVTGVLFAPRPS